MTVKEKEGEWKRNKSRERERERMEEIITQEKWRERERNNSRKMERESRLRGMETAGGTRGAGSGPAGRHLERRGGT